METVEIAHIITRLDRGGSAQNTLISAERQAEAGKRVALVSGLSLESDMSEEEAASLAQDVRRARAAGVRFFVEPNLVRRISPIRDMLAVAGLLRLLLNLRPKIVHTHTSKAGILGRAAALFAYPRPAVVHTPHGHIFQGYYGRVMTGIFIFMERLAARAAHAMVALTPRERADHLARKIGSPESFFVVPSGVDIEEFTACSRSREEVREELGLGLGEPVALTVGRLVEVKGQHFLLDAAALILRENPAARFVLVGEGPLGPALKSQAARLGIAARVVFTGFRNDVADILHAADLFVLTSLNEGMGRVLVEAMAAGLPVVAFGVGGVVDLVDHEVGGLVSPFDVAEFAGAATELMADPTLRAALSKGAKARARKYSIDAMLAGLDDAYLAAAKLRRGA